MKYLKMTEYNGDGGDYECPECGFMFGDQCDCSLPIEQDNQTIMDFCETNDLESLKTYLDNLCPIKGYIDFIYNNETPLAEACFCGYYDIVKLLLEKGANVNFADNLDNTPLHRACQGCHPKIVELLLKHGAKKNCGENAYSYTPEELASYCDDSEERAKIIELLKY